MSHDTRILLLTVLALSIGACSSSTTPEPKPDEPGPPTASFTVVPMTADTIEATPESAYVLTVVDGDGAPIVGTTVAFSGTNALVAAPAGSFGSSAAQVTDSRGDVAVMVRLGTKAGAALLIASVPTLQLGDTVKLTVSPGAAANVSLTPTDTTVVVGNPFSVAAATQDRRGNTVSTAPATLSVDFGSLTYDGATFVGTSFGSARIAAKVQGMTVYATVQVVPDGQLVYTKGSEAWLTALDGSGSVKLSLQVPSQREPSVSWNPAGSRIVLGGLSGFVVFDLNSQTVLPATWPGGVAGTDILWPRFGPNDRVYYSSADGNGQWDLRSMDPDGGSPSVLIASSRYPHNDFFPDWAPDGSRFAFTGDWEQTNRFRLRLSNPSTTTVTTINVEGVTPVWSPDGALIAYQELGTVGVVSPDESVKRSWGLGWSKGVTWSPDGTTLVGIKNGRIAIVDAQTGKNLVLTHLGNSITAVAWRPK